MGEIDRGRGVVGFGVRSAVPIEISATFAPGFAGVFTDNDNVIFLIASYASFP